MSAKPVLFKKCSGCGFDWKTRECFLADPKVMLVGYQVHFEHLALGLFLFNHACGTTMALEAKDFVDLYNGPIFKKIKTGTKDCKGFCIRKGDLRPCFTHCECAYIREVLQLVKNWKKSAA